VAGGELAQFVNTWASAAWRMPVPGEAWEQFVPYSMPASQLAVPVTATSADAPLKAVEYAIHDYIVANDTRRPLVQVAGSGGSVRATNGTQDFGVIESEWFCFGKCVCPRGTEGKIPSHRTAGPRLDLAVTGGSEQALGRVTYDSLDEFCQKQKPKNHKPEKKPRKDPRNEKRNRACQVLRKAQVEGLFGAGSYPFATAVSPRRRTPLGVLLPRQRQERGPARPGPL
jgi:hypothetical protein